MLTQQQRNHERIEYFLKKENVNYSKMQFGGKTCFIITDDIMQFEGEKISQVMKDRVFPGLHVPLLDLSNTIHRAVADKERKSKFVMQEALERFDVAMSSIIPDVVLNWELHEENILFGFKVQDEGEKPRLQIFEFDPRNERKLNIVLVYNPERCFYQLSFNDFILFDLPSVIETQINGMLCFMNLAGTNVNFMENESTFWLVEFDIVAQELTMLHGTEKNTRYLDKTERIDVGLICGIEAISKNAFNDYLEKE